MESVITFFEKFNILTSSIAMWGSLASLVPIGQILILKFIKRKPLTVHQRNLARLGCVILLFIVFSTCFSSYMADRVRVPNVVGLTCDSARQTLIEANLDCKSEAPPDDIVVGQSIAAGEYVKKGITIELTFKEEISAKSNRNQGTRGISLVELSCTKASDGETSFELYETIMDNLGNTYGAGYGGKSSYDENWQEYDVSQYKEIKGRVVLNYEKRADSFGDAYLKIYSDDIVVWISPNMASGQEPVDFELDIEESSVLRISIQGSACVRLVDCYLYKEHGGEHQSSIQYNDSNQKRAMPLKELDYWNASESNGGFSLYEQVKDNLGNVYADGIGGASSYSENWQEYYVHQYYKKIQGRIVLNYDNRSQKYDNIYVKIYGDDTLLYTSPLITAGQEPVDFSIVIENVSRVKISITGSQGIRLVDCYLYDNLDAAPISTAQKNQGTADKTKVSLISLDYWQASGDDAFRVYSVVKDNLGNIYGDGIGGYSNYEENWQEYYINGQYQSINGIIVLDYDARSNQNDKTYVKIYKDDELAYTSPLITAGQEPIPFHLDLSGIQKLRISIYGESMIRLVDTVLDKK